MATNSAERTIETLKDRFADEADAYAPQGERPLGGYLKLMGAYTAGVAALGGLVAWRRPTVAAPTPWDVCLVALATAKLARLASRDAVTSPLRAPFTTYEDTAGPAEVRERVRGEGTRHALGELVTCPFCIGQWIATGLGFGMVLAPRVTRYTAAVASALEVADFVQYGRAVAERAAEG